MKENSERIEYEYNKKETSENDPHVLIIIYTTIIVNPKITFGPVHMYETRLPIKRKFKEINIDYSKHALL